MSELEWLDIFSNNLLEMLDEAHMTQRELADEAGLSESTISHYINRTRMPGIRAILNIAYALDCDVNELIDFGDRIV